MICPACRRDTRIETTQGVLQYHNKYMKEIPVPRWGMWCTGCGHRFQTPDQEEMHAWEKKRMIKESEEPK